MIYQKIFPRVNDAIYGITFKMKETTKAWLFFSCAIVMESFFFTNFAAYGKPEKVMYLGSILTVLFSIFSIRRKSGNVVTIRFPYYFNIAFAIGILLISLHHDVGHSYIVFAIDILLVFPFLYYAVVNSECTRQLFKMISFGVVIESVCSFIICIVMSFRGELGMNGSRVMGHLRNPNLLGAIGLIALITGLYLMMDKKNPLPISVIASTVIGIGVSYMIVSSCRTALLSAIGCIFAYVVFAFKRRQSTPKRNIDTKFLMLTTVFALVLIIGMSLNDINAHYKDNSGISNEGVEIIQRAQNETSNELKELQHRLNVDKDAETFTSNRTGVWKIYIDNFSLFGMNPEDVKDQFADYSEWRAHNNLIDYYFRFGYVVGTLYLGFFVTVGVYGLKVLFSSKHLRDEDYFLVAIIGSYVLYSLVEIASLPFTRIIPCSFFLLICSMVFTFENDKDATQVNK